MHPVKQIIQSHWNRRAATFDDGPSHGLLNPLQESAWRTLLASLAGSPPQNILDLGCGTGTLAVVLAELGHHVTALDFAADMLVRARQKAAAKNLPITFLQADAEAPPLAAASFALIIERHLLWTLPNPLAALGAWRSLLAPATGSTPAGQLALIEGHWGDTGRQDEYVTIQDQLPLYGGRPADELIALAKSAGFHDITTQPLMDPALWTQLPSHPRYLIQCRSAP